MIKINRIGEKHITNQGCEVMITVKSSNDYFGFIFLDKPDFIFYRQYSAIKNGQIKNPFIPSVFGVGYLGIGKYVTSKNGKRTKSYSIWSSMLERSCCNKYKFKKPTYKDITLCEEWQCFQNFAQWHEENWKEHMDSSWDLDKDILFKGNKIYSPETCCFIPSELNIVFTKNVVNRGLYPIGVSLYPNGMFRATTNRRKIGFFITPEEAFYAYKIEKEEYIKEAANKWKTLITEQAFEALYNYKVEITD